MNPELESSLNLASEAYAQPRVLVSKSVIAPPPLCDVDSKLNPFRLESLLNEAIVLLNEAVNDRREWRDKTAQSFRVKQEVLELTTLSHINDAEQSKGIDTLPTEIAASQLAEAQSERRGIQNSLNAIERLVTGKLSNQEREQHAFYAGLFVDASTKGSYGATIPKVNTDKERDVSLNVALKDAAQEQVKRGLDITYESTLSQKSSLEGGLSAIDERVRRLERLRQWETDSEEFRRQRRELAEELLANLLTEYTRPNGALNFREQADSIEQRIDYSLGQAAARLRAVRSGLSLLFNRDFDEVPSGNLESLDNIAIWARNVLEYMRHSVSYDQGTAMLISLAEHFPKSYEDLLRLGCSSFELGPEALSGLAKHIRVRGISAAIKGEGVIKLCVSPPKQAVFVYGNGHTLKLTQDGIPPILLGRVQSDSIQAPREISGVNSLMNTSPFGTWKLEMARVCGDSLPADVLIEIYVIYHEERASI